jgi:hypothetical protein
MEMQVSLPDLHNPASFLSFSNRITPVQIFLLCLFHSGFDIIPYLNLGLESGCSISDFLTNFSYFCMS